jgi:type IV secretory pathway ATPase VirB11/archaellum biosynthesis ATPase
MAESPTLEVTAGEREGAGPVPAPLPPDDPEAWYAPGVVDQREVHPGVVVTIAEADEGFDYRVREPPLSAGDAEARRTLVDYFDDANLPPPRTREGTVERMAAGFSEKHAVAVARLTDLGHAARRRVTYWTLRDAFCLGAVTPHALDDRIEVAAVDGGELVVHTTDYAPAATGLSPDREVVRRLASERVTDYEVPFRSFDVPVVLYRERLLGDDHFAVKYAVREPDLLPGDEALVEACKERIWEAGSGTVIEDRAAYVREQARTFLSRRLTAHNTRAWVASAGYRLRTALSAYGLAVPPAGRRYAEDRLDDLVYYVLRDLVGEGKLTVPIRDPNLEDVEANRVGERIKVVPRTDLGHDGRVPTNLAFESETTFVDLVTQLAAADGTELNASTPSAKVNLDPDGVEATIRCAVALPTISEDGPHVSIRKQAPDVMTPVDLLERDAVSTDIVALLWLVYEHHGVVLFSGPTGVGKTTLMNAHMPFVPYDDRPISIDEGSREVQLPHETGVSLTTREHESEYKRVTMAELMTETNYLNPDVEVIAEINTPASFETFAETLNTGHGVVGTTHAEDVEKLVNRVVEQGLPAYLLRELDLLVFPRRIDGDRYVGQVVELVDGPPDGRGGTVEKDGTAVHWQPVAWRMADGEFGFRREASVFDAIADRTDRPLEDVLDEFERKHRYVRYLQREEVDDFEALFSFLADLRTDEAATVEQVARGDDQDRSVGAGGVALGVERGDSR